MDSVKVVNLISHAIAAIERMHLRGEDDTHRQMTRQYLGMAIQEIQKPATNGQQVPNVEDLFPGGHEQPLNGQ